MGGSHPKERGSPTVIAHKEKRCTLYYWSSRSALVEYFRSQFNVSEDTIEHQIALAQSSFRIRKNTAIDPRDLWQKTGLAILKRFPSIKATYCACRDKCEHMSTHGVCTWAHGCPWLRFIDSH